MTMEWVASINLGQVAMVAAVVGGFVATIRRITPPVRALMHLVDDIAGEPARPGHPAQPGMLERLSAVETAQRQICHQLAQLQKDLQRLMGDPT